MRKKRAKPKPIIVDNDIQWQLDYYDIVGEFINVDELKRLYQTINDPAFPVWIQHLIDTDKMCWPLGKYGEQGIYFCSYQQWKDAQ